MRAITPTKTHGLWRWGRFGLSFMARRLKLALRAREPFTLNLEAVSPNWLLLVVLFVNLGLWTLAVIVAGNVHHGLCQLDSQHATLVSKLFNCQ